MAIPIRFAPVLEGDEAIEFYERWHETFDKPDPRYPSEEKLAELNEFRRKNAINCKKKLQKSFE
jgi:hypothetical protein